MKINEIIDRVNAQGLSHRARPELKLIDVEKKMIPFIMVSSENAGERYDWYEDEVFIEKLLVEGAKFDELNTFFKDHEHSVDTAIGRVENIRIDGGNLKCDVYFGSDEDSMVIFNKYLEGILTDVSIGYTISQYTEERKQGEPTVITVTDYSIKELSAVWKGFDSKAKISRKAPDAKENEPQKIDLTAQVKRRFRILSASTGSTKSYY